LKGEATVLAYHGGLSQGRHWSKKEKDGNGGAIGCQQNWGEREGDMS